MNQVPNRIRRRRRSGKQPVLQSPSDSLPGLKSRVAAYPRSFYCVIIRAIDREGIRSSIDPTIKYIIIIREEKSDTMCFNSIEETPPPYVG